MKRITIIAGAVLFAGVNMGFASGLEGLRYGLELSGMKLETIKTSEIKAPGPVKFEAVNPAGTRAGGTGINLVIKGPGELVAAASGVFQATSDTPACMTTSWNEGSVTKIPKTVYPEFKQKNGLLTIPASIPSSCGFKRIGGGSLNFSIPGKAPAYNAVTLFPDGGGAAEQRVVCKKVMSGPKGNEPMIMCFGDVRLNASGGAAVTVALE